MQDNFTNKDIYSEIAYLRAQMKNVTEDIKDLRVEQRGLIQFMHSIRGGQAWFLGMLAIAGSIGGFISSIPKIFFNQ